MGKQILSEEIKRMQKLAGILKENENEAPPLTLEEKIFLEGEVETFLNSSLFRSDIVADDSEDFSPTREELAIQFIIDTLQERIDYYR
jgi:hypothetical protein